MNSDVLTQLSGADIARRIRDRELSPVEVVEGYLERIDRYDDVLHSYITVCRDEALAAARQAEQAVLQGEPVGPLHGLPLSVKDQLDTAGVLTTAGSTILADYVPAEDATLIARAKAAGAILLGKLNMTEFAAGQGDPFKHGDPARNPWDLERYPGSSSTGSGIAIAASLCAIALGEDTGGSIRGPASFCGIVGLRPTWGLLSRYRMWPISWSMDAAGPMTRTVEDTALLTGAIAGYDPKDPQTSRLAVPDYAQAMASGVRGLRVGLIQEFLDPDYADGEVVQAVRAAASLLGEMGAMVEDVGFPLGADMGTITDAIAINDGGYFHREWLNERPQDYGRNLRRRLTSAGLLPGRLRQKAMRMRELLRREWRALFQRYDILLSPTGLAPAPPLFYDEAVETREDAFSRFTGRRGTTAIAALCGTPAMSIPCGFTAAGLPIGLQIMADRFREDLVFRTGHAYEQSTDWHARRPTLAEGAA